MTIATITTMRLRALLATSFVLTRSVSTSFVVVPSFVHNNERFFGRTGSIGLFRQVSSSSSSSSLSLPSMTSSLTMSSSSSNNNAELAEGAEKLYDVTPLIYSTPISNLVGQPVYVKLDALQSSGSFKDRGMAHLCATYQRDGVTQLVSSSGGNAGLAAATVGKRLGMKVSVIVPETTKPLVIAKLQSLGATVTVHGENWNAADKLARERVDADPDSCKYVSPYDNPLLWTGHSTVVDEIVDELQTTDIGAIVISVGGGGLLCGILEGCDRHTLQTKVIACETDGASSFGQAWEKNEIITLPGISSIATSLGATSVTPVTLERAKQHIERIDGTGTGTEQSSTTTTAAGTSSSYFASSICTDREAIDACVQFAQDHRILVEPACGAGLAVAYSERLRTKYLKDVTDGPIILEVCGGSGINVDLLHGWKTEYGIE